MSINNLLGRATDGYLQRGRKRSLLSIATIGYLDTAVVDEGRDKYVRLSTMTDQLNLKSIMDQSIHKESTMEDRILNVSKLCDQLTLKSLLKDGVELNSKMVDELIKKSKMT